MNEMNKRVIEQNPNRNIFLIQDGKLSFYLIIPNSYVMNITIGLFENINDEAIKLIPNHKDKAIVVPVVNNQILSRMNVIGSNEYNYMDKLISYLINTSYNILSRYQWKINNEIYLNQNVSFTNFNNEYLKNKRGRVFPIDLFPKEEVKVEAPVVNNVAENNIVNNQNVDMPTEVMNEAPLQEEFTPKKRVREPGFVSYVLLGVIVAVMSLVFLYMIL